MFRERLRRAREAMRSRSLGALLTVHPPNIRYLTAYRGEDAALLIRPSSLSLVTDGRYSEEARLAFKVLDRERVRAGVIGMKGGLAEATAGVFRKPVVMGIEEATLSHVLWRRFRKALPKGSRLKPADGLVGDLRRRKDAAEVRALEEAVAVAEEAFRAFRRKLRPGITERVAARLVEGCLLAAGAEGVSFPVIVAAGANSSRPHHVPGDRRIRANDLVLVDWGASCGGYCSDLTRVLFMGKIRRVWRRAYEAVLAAHKQAASRAREGVSSVDVDRAAREALNGEGLAERFLHGLGHGIGIEVHETPTLSARAKGVLAAGDCFTIEPGVYIEGKFGIRLEDDYRIGRGGSAVRISRLPRDLAWASLDGRRSR